MGPQEGPLNSIENPNRIEFNWCKNISGKNKKFTGIEDLIAPHDYSSVVESTSYKNGKIKICKNPAVRDNWKITSNLSTHETLF